MNIIKISHRILIIWICLVINMRIKCLTIKRKNSGELSYVIREEKREKIMDNNRAQVDKVCLIKEVQTINIKRENQIILVDGNIFNIPSPEETKNIHVYIMEDGKIHGKFRKKQCSIIFRELFKL